LTINFKKIWENTEFQAVDALIERLRGCSLPHLELRFCPLDTDRCKKLVEALQEMLYLTTLKIEDFGDVVHKNLAQMVKTSKTLKNLFVIGPLKAKEFDGVELLDAAAQSSSIESLLLDNCNCDSITADKLTALVKKYA
jgi:hypothetical protein